MLAGVMMLWIMLPPEHWNQISYDLVKDVFKMFRAVDWKLCQTTWSILCFCLSLTKYAFIVGYAQQNTCTS